VRVETGEVGIEYQVTGTGRPVILLHGFPDSGRLWRNQVPALADAGFQVIVPDLRGYGRSDKPAAADAYSLLSLAGDVMAVLSDAGAERPTSWATTGERRWDGSWRRWFLTASIILPCCRSGTPRHSDGR
jgi:pimeloyl-ACP methyl ester carboxylesterase